VSATAKALAAASGHARHSWHHPKEHVYVCRRCGMGKKNVQRGPQDWYAVWLLPDGTTREGGLTPPCVPGPRTAERLKFYGLNEPSLL